MAGLLDALYANDGNNPTTMGLLGLGAGLLAGSRGNYGAFGPALASGMMGAAQGMQNAREFELQNAYRQAQIGKMQQDAARQQGIQALLSSRFGGAVGSPAASSRGGSPSAGGFPLNLQDVTMLKALGGPDLLDQLKYANEGSKREAGATYRNPMTGQMEFVPKVGEGMQVIYGPDGSPSVLPIPGYSAANAGAEGARAGAIAAAQMPYNIAQNRDQQNTAAGLDIVDVPDGRGGTVRMPRLAALQRLGGATGAAAPGSTSLGGQLDRFGRSSSPADQAFEKSLAEASAETYNNLQKTGLNADKQIANYQRIGSLLDGFSGSGLTNVGMSGAKLLNAIGLEVDPQLSNKEAAVAIGNQLALQLRDPSNGGGMPGAMSDPDREFLLQSIPNLNQTDEGRKKLISYQVRVLERNKDVAQFARKWRQKYGRLDSLDPSGQDFDTALTVWSAANPLFGAQ
ncbi:hypothetical protein GHR37_22235 [Achromobacter xylosoxidans]|nr:hypothetical protein [Achromobacter xylosoxidans]